MKKVDLVQGSPEWHAHRAVHKNASDIAVIMGIDKNRKRDDFIRECATGIGEDIDSFMQRRFDDGHEYEKLARPIADEIVGQELFPVVGTKVISGVNFSASFDGVPIDGSIVWEHKGLNQDLAEKIPAGVIDKMYAVQMEVQLAVSGASKALFMASKNGDRETEVHCWYESTPGLLDEIVSACVQFDKDVEDYEPVAEIVEPVAAPAGTLPAIQYNLNGLQITSNLDEYRAAAEQLVEASKLPMTTDQEFADAEVRNKALRKAVKNISGVCERVIQEVSDIYQFRETLKGIGEHLRQAALNGERQVTARKEQVRFEIFMAAKVKLTEHCEMLEDEIGYAWLSDYVKADFAGAAKGRSKLSSAQSAVNDELARAKIEADAVARKIRENLKTLAEDASEYNFLFADVSQIIYKEPDDFGALVRDRVAAHKAEIARKEEAARKAEEQRRKEAEEALRKKEEARKAEEERKIAERKAEQERKAQADADRKAKEEHDEAVRKNEEAYKRADDDAADAVRKEEDARRAAENNSEPVAQETPSSICDEITSDLLVKGIPLEYADLVAKLIVGGNVARVYCK